MTVQQLTLRWDGATWIYSDVDHDVVDEPFVAGVPDLIDALRERAGMNPNTLDAFRLAFACALFPHAHRVEIEHEEMGGVWVRLKPDHLRGWCCPHIHDYLRPLPSHVCANAQEIRRHQTSTHKQTET